MVSLFVIYRLWDRFLVAHFIYLCKLLTASWKMSLQCQYADCWETSIAFCRTGFASSKRNWIKITAMIIIPGYKTILIIILKLNSHLHDLNFLKICSIFNYISHSYIYTPYVHSLLLHKQIISLITYFNL